MYYLYRHPHCLPCPTLCPRPGGPKDSSPRREPWVHFGYRNPAPAGRQNLLFQESSAPLGLDLFRASTHGSRRGLSSVGAPHLSHIGVEARSSLPGSPSFLAVSPQHLAAGVLLESESGSVPMLFLNTANSLIAASLLIPEGFEQIARGREAHPGFPWERENNPGGVEASAGSAPKEGFEG